MRFHGGCAAVTVETDMTFAKRYAWNVQSWMEIMND